MTIACSATPFRPLFKDTPIAELPKLTDHELKVLRRVRAGDPYRDKAPGKPGRVARLKTLDYLRLRGLVRFKGGLWTLSRKGGQLLATDKKTDKT
jgi:hypothetical protein